MNKVFGKNQQINCSDETYYTFLGYLANHPHDIKIVYEENEKGGAWGNERRILFTSSFARNKFGKLGISFTEGTPSIDSRVNCNSLIEELNKLGFTLGSEQDHDKIKKHIPSQWIDCFTKGALMNQ